MFFCAPCVNGATTGLSCDIQRLYTALSMHSVNNKRAVEKVDACSGIVNLAT